MPLVTCGSNEFGQAGIGDLRVEHVTSPTPALLELGGTWRLLRLAAGGAHSVALVQASHTGGEKRLVAWGSNRSGQIGPLRHGEVIETPFWLPPSTCAFAQKLVDVVAGHEHTLFLLDDGTCVAWGANQYGQCGVPGASSVLHVEAGAAGCRTLRLAGMFGESRVLQLSGGVRSSLLVTSCGAALVLGGLHQKRTKYPHGHVFVLDCVDAPFVQGACGSKHLVLLDNKGQVWVAGSNRFGQHATPSSSAESHDFKLVRIEHSVRDPSGHPDRVTSVSSGWFHCAALTQGGRVVSWGRNDMGQLGFHAHSLSGSIFQVELPEPCAAVLCGSEFSLLVSKSGSVSCCGWGEHGNLGVHTHTGLPLGTETDEASPGAIIRKVPSVHAQTRPVVAACGGAHWVLLAQPPCEPAE
ncbi:Secretion-regulating guanine nucleotide exchange factor [Porphyridium purpureum]|uniref:Secretion-regulating guanine nucleotide exchange factor n=1 Tax=Porphyridium purpureum TaxID=35688 RepID=A0A5J4Z036_PORPP|nr:Secretion-regulating guanine nucleotide exchange factor [Porphyridium purpureum]|eukprot:POR2970..scf208_2